MGMVVSMSIKARVYLAEFLYFLLGVPAAFLAVSGSSLFLTASLAILLAVGIFTLLQRCPRCRKPVVNNPVRVGPIELWMFTPWVPNECSKCGYPLID